MGQSIKEWTKENLWKTTLKNLKGYGLLKQTIFLQFIKGYLPKVILYPFLNTWTHILKI